MDSVDKLTEIVWCDHVRVIPRPLVLHGSPHCYLPAQKIYIVVEELKIKLICPECWRRGIASHPLPFTES